VLDDRRRLLLRAALGFLQLPPRAPELRLRFSLTHIAEGEWRATFMAHPMFAPAGFGVAPTPWLAVQRAAWEAVGRERP
jgi:hypothetical protein